MSKISVLMSTYNVEELVAETIESILQQSFDDFELIVIDSGSTDSTCAITHSFKDSRINLIEEKYTLNRFLTFHSKSISSKYLTLVDAGDIWYSDRLRVQYSVMEEEPTITVCSSWIRTLGTGIAKGTILQTGAGILACPLLNLLQNELIFHSTAMIRMEFLQTHFWEYSKHDDILYHKMWSEIAKHGGIFYVDSQPLIYKHVYLNSDNDKTNKEHDKRVFKMQEEILDYLIGLNQQKYPSLFTLKESIWLALEENILNNESSFNFFYDIFNENKNKMSFK